MNRKNELTIIKNINQRLINNFQTDLKKNTLNKVRFHEKKQGLSWWNEKVITYLDGHSFNDEQKKYFSKLLEQHEWGSTINFKSLSLLLNSIENEVKDNALATLGNQISLLKNGYLSIIEANQKKHLGERNDLAIKNSELEISNKSLLNIVQERDLALSQEKLLKEELKRKLSDLESKLRVVINWGINNGKLITSNESYLIKNLKDLEKKIVNLQAEKNDKSETIQNIKLEIRELINQLEVNEKLLMDNQLINISLQASIALLEARIKELESQIEIYQLREANNIKLFSEWEKNQEKAEQLRKEEREDQYQTIWQNGQLITTITNLAHFIEDNNQEIINLKNEINTLISINKKLIEQLEITQKRTKVLKLANYLQTTSTWLLPEKYSSLVNTSILIASESYSGWSYELTFMIIGITLFLLLKRIITKFNKSNKEGLKSNG